MSTNGRLPRWPAIAFLVGAIAFTGGVGDTATAGARETGKASSSRVEGRYRIGISKHNRALGKKAKRRKYAKRVARQAGDPDIIFRAEHLSDFWLNQSAPGALSEVPDPAGSGQTVFKMTVGDSDVYPVTPTENPRAEMLSPQIIDSGDEFWWGSKFFLPADFPSSLPGWMNLMQGPYGQPWDGPPPWHIEVSGNHIQWTRNSTYDWDIPWQMPLVRNSWVSVVVHERFGADGWIEMWINGQPVTFFAGGTYNPNDVAPTPHLPMATMDGSNSAQANSVYLQSYRKRGMVGTLTSYAGPLTVGRTKASVEG